MRLIIQLTTKNCFEEIETLKNYSRLNESSFENYDFLEKKEMELEEFEIYLREKRNNKQKNKKANLLSTFIANKHLNKRKALCLFFS